MRKVKFIAYIKFLQEVWNVRELRSNGDVITDGYDYCMSKDDVVVMQFTGLYDQKYIQIFEGDIVIDHVGIGYVEYVDEYAAFRVNYGDGKCKWFTDYVLKGERESILVIGNIQEHPNMMKERGGCYV